MSLDSDRDNDRDWQGAFDGDGIKETRRKRDEYQASEKWVVDPIFPAGAMHLIGGPSGSGKTTWLLQQLWEWEQGLPLLGKYKSNPCSWVYICCDRSLRETTKTLHRLGYHNWDFEAYALEDLLPQINGRVKPPDLTDHIMKRFPNHELFVIEGLQALMPDVAKGRSQNKQELLWALDLRLILGPQNKTIIATTHNPKVNVAGGVTQDERSKFLGSQGFIGTCSTMVGIEKHPKKDDQRNVKIMGRNFADIQVLYTRDNRGMFQLEGIDGETVESETDQDVGLLTHAGVLKEFTAAQMHDRVGTGTSLKTIRRTLHRLVEQGLLSMVEKNNKQFFIYGRFS